MWSWAEMGLYDDVANIKMIKQEAAVDKVFYIGYSQGTIQMFYGLSHLESQFYADNLHKVVQLAPCFIYEPLPSWTMETLNNTLMQYQNYGVYAINGPNWKEDRKTICKNFSIEACAYYHTLIFQQG